MVNNREIWLTSGSAYINVPNDAGVDISPPTLVVRKSSSEVELMVR